MVSNGIIIPVWKQRKAVFIYSVELEKYRYPPEHPFNTIRARKTREILNSMGLLSGSGRNEAAPVSADRVVLKKFHSARYLPAQAQALNYISLLFIRTTVKPFLRV